MCGIVAQSRSGYKRAGFGVILSIQPGSQAPAWESTTRKLRLIADEAELRGSAVPSWSLGPSEVLISLREMELRLAERDEYPDEPFLPGIPAMFQYVLNKEDCVRLTPAPGVSVYATEGDRMTLTVMEHQPHAVTPEHSHPHEQVGYMVEGEAEFIIDGKSFPVSAGQMWRLPGGVPHKVIVGNRPMRVVEVFHPIRQDMRKS